MYPIIIKEDLKPVLVHFLNGRSAMTNFINGDKIAKEEASKLWNSQVYLMPCILCKFKVSGAILLQCVENMPKLVSDYVGIFGNSEGFAKYVVERVYKDEIDIIEFVHGYHILESSWKHYQLLVSGKYVKQ